MQRQTGRKGLELFLRPWMSLQKLSTLNLGIVLLVLLPIFYWVLNSAWGYPIGASVDSWVYYGHMIRPAFLLKTVPTYSASRMAYLLPGIFLNKLFSPLVANFLLKMFFYYLAVFSTYLSLKVTISARTGLITAVMMGSYLPFLAAIGWNYVDGGGIAYIAFTFLMLTLAAKSKSPQYWCLGAGVGAGLMFHTNIALSMFFPVLVIYFLGLIYFYHHQLAWRPLIFRTFIPAAAGVLLITAVISLINYTFDRNLLFFKWSFVWANNNIIQNDDGFGFSDTNSKWFLTRSYLSPLLAIFIGCILYLYPNKLKTAFSEEKPKTIFILFYLSFGIAYLIIQFLSPFYFLQVPTYTSYIYFPMFIALGILLANPAVLGLGKWQFSAIIGVIVLFSALPLRIEAFRDVLPETKDNRWMLQILLFVLPCITLLVLKPRLWSAVLVIISIGLVHYPIVNQITSPYPYLEQDYLPDIMIVVHDANAIIEDTTADEIIWFWYNQYDAEEPVMSTFTAIASSNLYRYRLVSPEFPKLYDYLRFEPNTNIALLWDDDPTTWDKVIDTLAIYCQEPTILADKLLKQGSIHLNMTIFSTDWIPNHEFQSDC